jgi:hypothetical protein
MADETVKITGRRTMAEFIEGQAIKCIDARMDGCGPALDEGRIYHVRKFTPPDRCVQDYHEWHLHGGRIEVMELPGGDGAGFYGRRFIAVRGQRP